MHCHRIRSIWKLRGSWRLVLTALAGAAVIGTAHSAQNIDVVRGTGHSSGRPTGAAAGIEVIRGTGRASEHAKKRAGKWQRIYAYDGDTFTLGDGRRVRIAGIDAPEIHPPRCAEEKRLGEAARAKLQQLLDSGTVTMSGSQHDQYGRDLRNVQVNGQDVGEAMMSAGLARGYDGKKRRPWC